MTTYQVAYDPTSRVALVQADAATVPEDSVNVGSFEHPDPIYPGSEVVFHAVRDLLYKRSAANPANNAMFPENITDMQNVDILLDSGIEPADLIAVTKITFAAADYTVAVDGTVQLQLNIEPANATDEGITYSSSDAGVATVSETGLVTGVAEGAATILAQSSEDEDVFAEVVVNVTA